MSAAGRKFLPVLASLLLLSAYSSAQFETRSTTLVSGSPLSFAFADFNDDGKLDVAAATEVGRVAVILGRGDGTFGAPTFYKLDSAYSVATGDFNGDHNLDLAVADRLGNNISILLGNGDGTFQPPRPFPVSANPTYLALGDFNNDGNLDVVVCDSPYITVLLGNGDGTVQAPRDSDISFCSAAPNSVAVGDFNGDQNLDVAFAGSNDASVLLGNGDGTFEPVFGYAAGSPISIATGDLNNDGKLDLALTAVFGGVNVLLGNGDGTFQSAVSYPVDESGTIWLADFNRDGNLDVAVAAGAPTAANVLLGNGDGTLRPATGYPAGTNSGINVGDVNGDHQVDLLYADEVGSTVGVLLNTGAVSFSPTTPLDFGTQFLNVTSKALNVTLTNTGVSSLSISGTRITGPFRLGSQTTCGSSVAAGENCTLSVQFRPSAIGTANGLLTLSDSASSKAQVIELTGVGTIVKVQPGKLNFGTLKVGTRSAPQTVTVTNVGSTALNISSITFTGSDHTEYSDTNTCGKQLGPGANCTISVTFAPLLKGTRVAMLQITDDGGASPQIVQLSGIGD